MAAGRQGPGQPPRTGRQSPPGTSATRRAAGWPTNDPDMRGCPERPDQHAAQVARRGRLHRLQLGADRLQARGRHHVGLHRHHLGGPALGLRPRGRDHRLLLGAQGGGAARPPPSLRPREGGEPERRHRGAAHHRRRRGDHLRGHPQDHRRAAHRPHLAGHRRDARLGRGQPRGLEEGALPGRQAHAVGGARGRRRASAHRRLHVVRRGRRPAARQAHRAGSASTPSPPSPWPCSSSGRATSSWCSPPRCCSTRRCPRRSSRRSAAASRITAATSSGATTSCAPARPAAGATSTCTSPSTRP